MEAGENNVYILSNLVPRSPMFCVPLFVKGRFHISTLHFRWNGNF